MSVFPFRLGAILSRLLSLKRGEIQVYGLSSSLPIAETLAVSPPDVCSDRPTLLVFSDEDACDDFEANFRFFSPSRSIHRLPGFDVSPYSQLYPNSRIMAQRLGWLHRASTARGGDVFVAPIHALLQNTLPASALRKHSLTLRVGHSLPDRLAKSLSEWGYTPSPRTEDLGQFSTRGGIFDVFSPAHPWPVRIELFGDTIESLRFYDPESQRTIEPTGFLTLIPAREVLLEEADRDLLAGRLKDFLIQSRGQSESAAMPLIHEASLGRFPQGIDFLIELFYEHLESPLSFLSGDFNFWFYDPVEILRASDRFSADLQDEFKSAQDSPISPTPDRLYSKYSQLLESGSPQRVNFARIRIDDHALTDTDVAPVEYRTTLVRNLLGTNPGRRITDDELRQGSNKLQDWQKQGFSILVSCHTQTQAARVALLIERMGFQSKTYSGDEDMDWPQIENQTSDAILIVPRRLVDSFVSLEDRIVFLREEDFLGKKKSQAQNPQAHINTDHVKSLQFGDIKPGDYIVHIDHGVGVFDGLKLMAVNGIESEFVQLRYKDGDKLYLPIYRISQIQKYSGVGVLDKLGGSSWQKAKVKVQHHLRDLASELLSLYAKRSLVERPTYSTPNDDHRAFEDAFPYDETSDQLAAIEDIGRDFNRSRPADRLVCGDVGFGKTEVAMRAAFRAAYDRKLVCVLVPTTVLALQHLETFRKRFAGWPFRIEGLSRFTDKSNSKKILDGLKEGAVDIVIGTHRLLSKDVVLKNLGLLVVDEEQRFGVAHKEKIKKLMVGVDTLMLSATPIPRTLNMSLMGIRDLSLINSAPSSRLPTRTFVCRYDEETIKKAVLSEVQRGGQVFFVHNRVQSIYETAGKLREFLPDVRIAVAHGQMEEGELEKTMVAFYHHEYDLLLCTTIIESGVDIPSANTIILDRADTFGLSQLYQLRGRVGRGKDRAYCYLLIPRSGNLDPTAQERLKVIQENTALGSGYIIANHDLELRGAGNILGESQSGHVNAVGYELYLELLQAALAEARGTPPDLTALEPDINLRIPALIPDSYMADIRIRLSYYKLLSGVKAPEDLDSLEAELSDQFGPPPQPVLNLMGIMLIRRHCKELGIRDLSGTQTAISLAFTEKTPVAPQVIVGLVSREQKKYGLTPDNRLTIKLDAQSWPLIYDEVLKIRRLAKLD